MKRSLLLALTLLAPTFVTPLATQAAEQTQGSADVCGRVLAPTRLTTALALNPGENIGIVIARSSSEEVQTTVASDGSYCFHGLHLDLHTLSAFGDDSLGGYTASVVPVAGTLQRIDLKASAGLTQSPAF